MRCKLTNSISQSSTSGNFLLLTWDTEVYDTGALHSTVTNPSRITVPAGGATGVWTFAGVIAFAGNVTGDRLVRVTKNGSVGTEVCLRATSVAGVATGVPFYFADDAPSVNDYYEVSAWQNSGGALNVLGIDTNYTNFTAIHNW
jgi:hypothetical protein